MRTAKQEIEALELKISVIQQIMKPLYSQRAAAESKLKDLRSHAFIEENNIERGNVWDSDGPDMPWFGGTDKFIEWMNAQPNYRTWCAWGGRIYKTKEFKTRGLACQTPALLDHLPDHEGSDYAD